MSKWSVLHRATDDVAQRHQIILKLHGTLLDRESRVLTRDEHEHAMYADPQQDVVFSAFFRAYPLLFVGFDPADEDLDRVLKRVPTSAEGQPPRHFALMSEESVKGAPHRKTQIEKAGVRIIAYPDPDGLQAELPGILRRLAPTPTTPDRNAPQKLALLRERRGEVASVTAPLAAGEEATPSSPPHDRPQHPPADPPAPHPRRSRRLPIALAFGLVAALGAAGSWLSCGAKSTPPRPAAVAYFESIEKAEPGVSLPAGTPVLLETDAGPQMAETVHETSGKHGSSSTSRTCKRRRSRSSPT